MNVVARGGSIVGDHGFPVTTSPPHQPWLVGIYAGRCGTSQDELDMALGRCWKATFLDGIFFHQVPGGTEARATLI